MFLKFRSMYVDNDHSVHREYVTKLINNETGADKSRRKSTVYKLTGDKRITPIGRFLAAGRAWTSCRSF